MYTIITNKWTEQIDTWRPYGEVWSTDCPKEAIRQLAYLRFAYPESVFSLVVDGYILSGLELSRLAQWIILDA